MTSHRPGASTVLRVLFVFWPFMAARYAAGDFIHRDSEEERKAWARD